ncbi:MAG: amidohydrolase, partial [Pseudanabaena sp.]
ADFKAYVFSNPHKFYTQANANFFKGTQIEAKLNKFQPAPIAAKPPTQKVAVSV